MLGEKKGFFFVFAVNSEQKDITLQSYAFVYLSQVISSSQYEGVLSCSPNPVHGFGLARITDLF